MFRFKSTSNLSRNGLDSQDISNLLILFNVKIEILIWEGFILKGKMPPFGWQVLERVSFHDFMKNFAIS